MITRAAELAGHFFAATPIPTPTSVPSRIPTPTAMTTVTSTIVSTVTASPAASVSLTNIGDGPNFWQGLGTGLLGVALTLIGLSVTLRSNRHQVGLQIEALAQQERHERQRIRREQEEKEETAAALADEMGRAKAARLARKLQQWVDNLDDPSTIGPVPLEVWLEKALKRSNSLYSVMWQSPHRQVFRILDHACTAFYNWHKMRDNLNGQSTQLAQETAREIADWIMDVSIILYQYSSSGADRTFFFGSQRILTHPYPALPGMTAQSYSLATTSPITPTDPEPVVRAVHATGSSGTFQAR